MRYRHESDNFEGFVFETHVPIQARGGHAERLCSGSKTCLWFVRETWPGITETFVSSDLAVCGGGV